MSRRTLFSHWTPFALAALTPTLWAKGGAAQTREPSPYELLDQMGQALAVIEREYHEPADEQKLLSGALRGMVGELDPHSVYLDRNDLQLFEGSTKGEFGGIGVEVEFTDGKIIVIAPVEGSPADRAGIKAGDHIVALDGIPLGDVKPYDVVARMRGEIGTPLRLTIREQDTSIAREVTVTREQISVASVRSQAMDRGVAYLRIKAFQEGTHSELLEELGQLRKEVGELSGVILDLRNNPGGLVHEAAAVADQFLNGGVIFSTRHRGKDVRVETARRGGAWIRGPLVVLINEYSASAAELVAGALRDHHRARLVGARTFGKGSVQTLLGLGHGGALKLTTALYFTPSGQTVQAQGVEPHIAVDPGYVAGTLGALKERDLKGHLGDSTSSGADRDATLSGDVRAGAPPTNNALHLGVARYIPRDPTDGPDTALSVAYQLVLGLPLTVAGTSEAPSRASPVVSP